MQLLRPVLLHTTTTDGFSLEQLRLGGGTLLLALWQTLRPRLLFDAFGFGAVIHALTQASFKRGILFGALERWIRGGGVTWCCCHWQEHHCSRSRRQKRGARESIVAIGVGGSNTCTPSSSADASSISMQGDHAQR